MQMNTGTSFNSNPTFKNHNLAVSVPQPANQSERGAYMTFLEVQLERVTQACLNAVNVQEQIDRLRSDSAITDDKVNNVSRLVKLL